jgi:hypothetical protein
MTNDEQESKPKQRMSKDKKKGNSNEDFQLRGRVGDIGVPRQLEFLQRRRKDKRSKGRINEALTTEALDNCPIKIKGLKASKAAPTAGPNDSIISSGGQTDIDEQINKASMALLGTLQHIDYVITLLQL